MATLNLKKKLTPLQYQVTQEGATEPAFKNAYWNLEEAGVFVDVITGEPLFSSLDKFDSGMGWPSFMRPINAEQVVTKSDSSHGMTRTEARSKIGNTHLGHVFNDGPKETGLRYCINSAALRFIPVSQLKIEGYEKYESLFKNKQQQIAFLAGGCFWGMEEILREILGVLETEVGYMKRAEAVRVTFDSSQLSYEDLLEKYFFKMHDPTTLNQQGNDRGKEYRSVIFYTSEAQKKVANQVKERVQTSGIWKKNLTTEISKADKFIRAEKFHQGYLQKHPEGYTCHFLRPL